MNFIIFMSVTVLASCVYAQVSLPPGYKEKYPKYYLLSRKARPVRDATLDKNVVNGKVHGILENNAQGHFLSGTGSGEWNLDKNSRLSAGRSLAQQLSRGKPDVVVHAQFQKD